MKKKAAKTTIARATLPSSPVPSLLPPSSQEQQIAEARQQVSPSDAARLRREPPAPKVAFKRTRVDYRSQRARETGRTAINILIDPQDRIALRLRMMARNLTWETLFEGLLKQWLDENPEIEPEPSPRGGRRS